MVVVHYALSFLSVLEPGIDEEGDALGRRLQRKLEGLALSIVLRNSLAILQVIIRIIVSKLDGHSVGDFAAEHVVYQFHIVVFVDLNPPQ